MKIAIGSDHAGFQYKDKIRDFLESLGHNVTDFGTHSEEPVDYPLFIRPVAEAVARGEFDRGIVLGGSGNGEANATVGISCTSSRSHSRKSISRTSLRIGSWAEAKKAPVS